MAVRTDCMLAMVIDADLPIEVTSEGEVWFNSSVSLAESIEAYVSADIPINTVHSINKDIPVPIPLPAPLAALIEQDYLELYIPLRLDFPLSTVVHIEQAVPVWVGQDIPVSASVPIHTRTPISISVDETPLQSELQAFRMGLLEFASQ